VIEIRDRKAEIIDYKSCLECGACELNCEFEAITVTKGTGCLVAIIKEDILKIVPKNTGCGCGGECC
jgi:MinD superfamily P-loop ATPase